MAETRRMHFVPRTYLKYFADARGDQFFIHALNKKTGNVFTPNIINVCNETDLYRLDGATADDRQRIEVMYRELFEDGYDAIYMMLTDEAKLTVTMAERYDIISFVVSLYFRNNAWNNFFYKTMDDIYARAYNATKANNKDSFFFEEQEISIAGKTLEQLQKEDRERDRKMIAAGAMEYIFKLTRLRMSNDVVTVVKTEDEILTSDNPVIVQAENIKDRVIPLNPMNTLTLPINANHVLQLRPWGHQIDRTMLGRISEKSVMSTFYAEANNQTQFGQNGMFLLGSEVGIKNFKHDPTGELLKNNMRMKFSGK